MVGNHSGMTNFLEIAKLSSQIFFLSVPSGPVLNTVGAVTSPTSANASWDPPLLDQQNGIIEGYIVNVTTIADNEVLQLVTQSTSLEIATLSPFRTYYIVVAAFTSTGIGPFGSVITISTPQTDKNVLSIFVSLLFI